MTSLILVFHVYFEHITVCATAKVERESVLLVRGTRGKGVSSFVYSYASNYSEVKNDKNIL